MVLKMVKDNTCSVILLQCSLFFKGVCWKLMQEHLSTLDEKVQEV